METDCLNSCVNDDWCIDHRGIYAGEGNMSDSMDRIIFACEQLTTGKCPMNRFMDDQSAIDIFECYAEPRTHWERVIDDKDLAIKIMSKCIVKLASQSRYKNEVEKLRVSYYTLMKRHDEVKLTNRAYKKKIKELEEEKLCLYAKTNTDGQHI